MGLAISRRRWSAGELKKAERNGPHIQVPRAIAHTLCASFVETRLGDRIQKVDDARFLLRAGIHVGELKDITATCGREIAVLRAADHSLQLKFGDERRVLLDPGETVLVHTHVADVPPSGSPSSGIGDIPEAGRKGQSLGCAVVGPDGRVTDYGAGGLTPDTELSYVGDDGIVDGRLHRVYRPAPPEWQRRPLVTGSAKGGLQVSPLASCWRALIIAANVLWFLARFSFSALGSLMRGKEMRPLFAREAASLCVRLGPLWVKVGQGLSSRADLFSPHVLDELRHLQSSLHRDRAGAAQVAEPWNTTRAMFGGSVATIYVAHHQDRKIAFKVIEVAQRRKAQADLAIVRAFAAMFAALPVGKRLPVLDTVSEMDALLTAQFDTRAELRNTQRFKAYAQTMPTLRVPHPYDELTRDGLLALEFIPDLIPLPSLPARSARSKRAASDLVAIIYWMLFDTGFIHVDMHPGNIFTTEGQQIVLLDFGLVAEIGPDEKKAFADLFYAMSVGDHDELGRVVYETALSVPTELDIAAFKRDIRNLGQNHRRARVAEFSVGAFVTELMQLMWVHRITSTASFSAILTSLVMVEGLIKQLDPDCDFQGRALIHITKLRGAAQTRHSRTHRVRGVRRP